MQVRIRKKLLLIMLILTMIFSSITSYSNSYFTDVKADHWAKSFIDKLYELGIAKGGDDATFRPGASITKAESIAMIYQLLNKTGNVDPIVNVIDKHTSTLTSTGVTQYTPWARESIAYCLEKGILHPDEVKTFYLNGKQVNAKRKEIAVFLAKALNADSAIDEFVILPFVDREFIPSQTAKYIDFLIQKGIINSKGDEQGRFNPDNNITRAEIATMISLGYDSLQDGILPPAINDPVMNPDPIIAPVVDVIDKKGTISYIDNSSILIQFDMEKELFPLTWDVIVRINGSSGTFTDLQVGQEVLVTFKDNKLTKIETTTLVPNIEGKVSAVVPNTGFTLLVVREDLTNVVKSLKVTNSTTIKLNGQAATVSMLKTGDILKLRVDGQDVVAVEATSKIKTYSGTLTAGIPSTTNPKLFIEIEDEIKEFTVKTDAGVVKNGNSRTLTYLKKGDKAVITTEYDVVTEIRANSVFSKVAGKIVNVSIGKDNSSITIENNEGKNTYSIDKNVSIKVNNLTKTLYDLRVDQLAEIELENDEVIGIAAREDTTQKQISGVVTSINTSSRFIRIEYIDPVSKETKTKRINYTTDTTFVSLNSVARISASSLKANDQITAFGDDREDQFNATRIILVD